MSKRYQILLSAMAIVGVIGIYLLIRLASPGYPEIIAAPSLYDDSPLPEFAAVTDVATKKANFFSFLLPLVETENNRILLIRQELQLLRSLSSLERSQQQWLDRVTQHYRITKVSGDHQQLLAVLLQRVDIVPPSLALAQSANESAWGRSRFAQQGNNLFGQWCFTKGCGIVPGSRTEGALHEVAVFESPGKSVEGYIHNLNSNMAYEDFRRIREVQRAQQSFVSGEVLAEGLLKYSARGVDYIKELRAMIAINKLEQYDKF
jgi:Bax protein